MRIRVLPLLAALSLPAFADDWSKSFPVSGRAELRVDADDASVSIRPWDRNEIQARVTTVGWRISPSEVRVLDRQSGGRLFVARNDRWQRQLPHAGIRPRRLRGREPLLRDA